MAKKMYNSRLVNVIITYLGEKYFLTGFAKSSPIKCSKNSDYTKEHTGMKGETSFSATNDDSGKIEFTLTTDSPSNSLLDKICKAYDTFDVDVIDGNDMTKGKASGTECVIKKQADWERGSELKDRKWIISVPNLDMGDE